MATLEAIFADWLIISRRLLAHAERGPRKMLYIELVKTTHLYGIKFFDALQKSDDPNSVKVEKFQVAIQATDQAHEHAKRIESRPRMLTEEY